MSVNVRLGSMAGTLRQRAIVVVGASRSGTSVITRGLQALGVELGDHLRPGTWKNPQGFFEDQDLLDISRRLRRAFGLRPRSVALVEPSRWQEPEVQALRQEAVETIRRRFGRYPLWGFKDGRTLRFLPFWQEVFASLDAEVNYVVVARNPLNVARSRRRLDLQKLTPWGVTQEKGELEWLVYVVPYFRKLREQTFVVVDYGLVMANPEGQLRRAAAALNLTMTSDVDAAIWAYAEQFLRPELQHSRLTDEDLDRDARANDLARDAYRWLHRLATDEIDRSAPELWEDWERIERTLTSMAPVLRHLDRVEADLRRARWNPLSPLQVIPQVWRRVTRGIPPKT